MEDNVGQNKVQAAAEADTTTLVFGQAEPGHDVFNVEEKPKSDGIVQPAPADAEDPKLVSTVQTTSELEKKSTDETEKGKDETVAAGAEDAEDKTAQDPVSSAPEAGADADAATPPPESSPDAVSVNTDARQEQVKIEGPPEEIDAEAERIRQELFPDES